MDCGSKGCRFDSFFLPMDFWLFKSYNSFTYNFKYITKESIFLFIKNFYFIVEYFSLNNLIWQEGLLIDFLQKKVADNWIRKFLIYSAYLFSERLVFDKVIRFYLDLLIWPLHKASIFEFNNVSNTIFITIFLFFSIFFLVSLFYFFILIF